MSPFNFPAPQRPLQSGCVVSEQKSRTSTVLHRVMGTRLWLRSDPALRNRKDLEGRKSIPRSHIPKEPRRKAIRFPDIWFKRCFLRKGEIGLSCKGLGLEVRPSKEGSCRAGRVSLEINSSLTFRHTQPHGQRHHVPLYAITMPYQSLWSHANFAEREAKSGESETTWTLGPLSRKQGATQYMFLGCWGLEEGHWEKVAYIE